MKDFSHLFTPNETSVKLAGYLSGVCGKCRGTCCTYNISPIDHHFSLPYNLDDDNIIILKKALILCKEYRMRFFRNVCRSLTYLEKKGFGRGLLKYVKSNKFSLRTIVKAYRRANRNIDLYNSRIQKIDPYEMNHSSVSDCLFLIPGQGCIMEEHKPFTCITAFRNCFSKLDLFEYVDSRVYKVKDANELLDYMKEDFRLGEHCLPKIIIGANQDFISRAFNIGFEKKPAFVGDLTYHQLALLADFITLPFSRIPYSLKEKINRKKFYIMRNIKDPPVLTFADSLSTGLHDNAFDFGLDYVQVFQINSV